MVDFASLLEIAKIILSGAAAAGGAAALGYLRAHYKDGEAFNFDKFTQLSLLGLVFGGVAAGLGWQPMDVESYLIGLGLLSAVSLWTMKAAQALVSFVRAKFVK